MNVIRTAALQIALHLVPLLTDRVKTVTQLALQTLMRWNETCSWSPVVPVGIKTRRLQAGNRLES